MNTTRKPVSLLRIPELDGIRGLAVLWVVAHHANIGDGHGWIEGTLETVLETGWAGVDLFFALSGFLITRILIDTKDSADYYWRFYTRRTKRILPLYALAIGIAFAACPGAWVWRFATYTANLTAGDWTFGGCSLGHFWSLCVEEHFYLAWPIVVRAVPVKRLPTVALCVAGFSVLARLVLMDLGWHFDDVLKFTPCRLDGIALGSALAVTKLPRPGRWCLGSILGAFVLGLTLNHHGTAFVTFGRLFVTLACVSFVAWSIEAKPRILTDPWLLKAGELSYGIYVWHYLFAGVLIQCGSALLEEFGYIGGTVISICLWLGTGVTLAVVSQRLIEQPAMRFRWKSVSENSEKQAETA